MRRYIRPEPTQPKKRKPSKRRKQADHNLSIEDIESLPIEMRQLAVLPKPVQPKPAKPIIPDCVEPVFINSRTPGSKILNHRRQAKYPHYTFEDRLNRTNVLDHYHDHLTYLNIECDLKVWICTNDDPDAEDVNVHLIDRDAEPDEVKTFQIIQIKLVSKHSTKYLIDTPAGRVCPKCKTNEYIKSDLKNTPISYQDANWRDKESYGEHCVACQTISR